MANIKGWRRKLAIMCLVATWYTSSITIVFANKHLLSTGSFKYPFFMTAVNNGVVFAIAWLVTRLPWLHQPPLSTRVVLQVVLPIGLCTALDIGLFNWSLSLMSVSFHTILKGTIPAFVLIAGWLLKLERASPSTACSVLLIVVGIGLAAAGEVHFSTAGLVLGLGSAWMGGTRWALTQLLMNKPADTHASNAGASAGHNSRRVGNGGDSGDTSSRGSGVVKGANGAGSAGGTCAGGTCGGTCAGGTTGDTAEEEAVKAVVQKQISRHANPLGSMLFISPVTASCALLPALLLEIFDTPWVRQAADEPALVNSRFVHSSEAVFQLAGSLGAIAVLVFVLLLAEFALVSLTSSLSLSILGILKELLTIALAGGLRGEPLTVMNLAGFVICSFGALLYHFVRQRKEAVASMRAALRTVRHSVGAGQQRFVQMMDEIENPHVDNPEATAAARSLATTAVNDSTRSSLTRSDADLHSSSPASQSTIITCSRV